MTTCCRGTTGGGVVGAGLVVWRAVWAGQGRVGRGGGGGGGVRVISVSASKELIWNKTEQHRRTDIWSRFGISSAQIPFAFPKSSGSES